MILPGEEDMAKLQDFIISKVRVKLLQTFLSDPQEMFYIRQLTRLTQEEINAVRRELLRMQSVGMLRSEKRGNRIYYSFNKNYLFYRELIAMVARTYGLGQAIVKNKNKLGKVKFAVLSGRFARKMPRKPDTVDLLLVGNIVLPQLAAIVQEQEKHTNREINYTVMTEEELKYRKSRRDPFIHGILLESRIMLIGDEEELLA